MNLKQVLISLSLLTLTPHQVLSSGGEGKMPDLKDEDSSHVSSLLPSKNESSPSSSGTSSSSSSSSHPLSPTESSDKNPKNAISTCLSNLREKWEPLQKKVTFLEALAKSLDPDPLFSPKVKSQLTTILPSLKSPKDLLPSLNAALLAESFSWKDEFLKPLISIQEQIDTILTSLSAPPEGNSTVDTLENIKTFYRSSYHALQQARGRRLLGCSGHPTRGGGYSRSGGGEVKQ